MFTIEFEWRYIPTVPEFPFKRKLTIYEYISNNQYSSSNKLTLKIGLTANLEVTVTPTPKW